VLFGVEGFNGVIEMKVVSVRLMVFGVIVVVYLVIMLCCFSRCMCWWIVDVDSFVVCVRLV